ncbi:MAG: hypothetical protein ACO32S_05540 [Steroidobacteraceae bacterium]
MIPTIPQSRALTSSHVPSLSLFAQLLASERLHIAQSRAVKTASFSPEQRVLTLPAWQGWSDNAWLLFIAHEVGHALYTPTDAFTCPRVQALNQQYRPQDVMVTLNVFEDIRIERKIREAYRGLMGVFNRGYHDLLGRDFFSLSTSAFAERGVLDQVNLYAKVGRLTGLTLVDPCAAAYYNAGLAAETYDDVLTLVERALRELSQQQPSPAPQPPSPASQPPSSPQAGLPGSETSDETTGPETSQDARQTDETETRQDAQADAGDTQDASETSASASVTDASETDGQDAQDASQTPESGQTADYTRPFDVQSQEAAARALAQSAADRWGDDHDVMLAGSDVATHAGDVSLEQLIGAWKATEAQREGFRQILAEQRRNESSILASMIATFRANQAAWQAQRVQVSRTGLIDTAKLSQYKLTEDLFLRRRSLPNAQNHGFVIHMDWSGSMDEKMATVLWQVLHLIWFAESIKVPVRVYGFTDSGRSTPEAEEYYTNHRRSYRPARLVEAYRSDAPVAMKQQAQALLLATIYRYSGGLHMGLWETKLPKALRPTAAALSAQVCAWGMESASDALYHPYIATGGTPLFNALHASVDLVREFRMRNRIEQCVSVWLTDGSDTHGVPVARPVETVAYAGSYSTTSQRYFGRHDGTITDLRSGRRVTVEHGRVLAALFTLHRALTGATVICIDITDQPLASYARVVSHAALGEITAQMGESVGYGGAGRRKVRAKQTKQTRRRVVVRSSQGSFTETGLVCITNKQYPEIGCDAYLVTHPAWWSHDVQPLSVKAVREQVASSVVDTDDDESRDAQEVQTYRRIALSRTLIDAQAHIAMRRFADLLVPYMAVGREDATV